MLKEFTLLGERCSGTKWLRSLIENNFDIIYNEENPNRHKHWYGFKTCDEIIKASNNKLHIAIVRDPYEWLMAFDKMRWYQPHNSHLGTVDWLTYKPFYSAGAKCGELSTENFYWDRKEDNTQFINIFELRNYKNKYILDRLPLLVDCHYFIRYEDLLNNTGQILLDIKNKFNLVQKHNYISFETKIKNKYNISENIKQIIYQNLNIELERRLGYKI